MSIKGIFSDEYVKDFENLLGHELPNGVVMDGVLGWLYAADKLDKDTKIKVMMERM